MQIKDVMTTNVASVKPQDTIEKTAQLMQQYNVGSIPVCNGQQVVGIVTDRDISLRCVAQGLNTAQVLVNDIMTPNPVTSNPATDVHEAAQIMSKQKIRRLPVVDQNNLVGMIALGDIAVEPNLSDNAGDALNSISTPAKPNIQSF